MNKGLKFDEGKPQLDLVPPDFVVALCRVFEYGAKKYGKDNWKEGLDPAALYNAAMRHMFAWMDGEDVDPESGLPHVYHAAWNMLMIQKMEEREL